MFYSFRGKRMEHDQVQEWKNEISDFFEASCNMQVQLGLTVYGVPCDWSFTYLREYISAYTKIGNLGTIHVEDLPAISTAWEYNNVYIPGRQYHIGCRSLLQKTILLNTNVMPVLSNSITGQPIIIFRPYRYFYTNPCTENDTHVSAFKKTRFNHKNRILYSSFHEASSQENIYYWTSIPFWKETEAINNEMSLIASNFLAKKDLAESSPLMFVTMLNLKLFELHYSQDARKRNKLLKYQKDAFRKGHSLSSQRVLEAVQYVFYSANTSFVSQNMLFQDLLRGLQDQIAQFSPISPQVYASNIPMESYPFTASNSAQKHMIASVATNPPLVKMASLPMNKRAAAFETATSYPSPFIIHQQSPDISIPLESLDPLKLQGNVERIAPSNLIIPHSGAQTEALGNDQTKPFTTQFPLFFQSNASPLLVSHAPYQKSKFLKCFKEGVENSPVYSNEANRSAQLSAVAAANSSARSTLTSTNALRDSINACDEKDWKQYIRCRIRWERRGDFGRFVGDNVREHFTESGSKMLTKYVKIFRILSRDHVVSALLSAREYRRIVLLHLTGSDHPYSRNDALEERAFERELAEKMPHWEAAGLELSNLTIERMIQQTRPRVDEVLLQELYMRNEMIGRAANAVSISKNMLESCGSEEALEERRKVEPMITETPLNEEVCAHPVI